MKKYHNSRFDIAIKMRNIYIYYNDDKSCHT